MKDGTQENSGKTDQGSKSTFGDLLCADEGRASLTHLGDNAFIGIDYVVLGKDFTITGFWENGKFCCVDVTRRRT